MWGLRRIACGVQDWCVCKLDRLCRNQVAHSDYLDTRVVVVLTCRHLL